jgi:hypothetical protein
MIRPVRPAASSSSCACLVWGGGWGGRPSCRGRWPGCNGCNKAGAEGHVRRKGACAAEWERDMHVIVRALRQLLGAGSTLPREGVRASAARHPAFQPRAGCCWHAGGNRLGTGGWGVPIRIEVLYSGTGAPVLQAAARFALPDRRQSWGELAQCLASLPGTAKHLPLFRWVLCDCQASTAYKHNRVQGHATSGASAASPRALAAERERVHAHWRARGAHGCCGPSPGERNAARAQEPILPRLAAQSERVCAPVG